MICSLHMERYRYGNVAVRISLYDVHAIMGNESWCLHAISTSQIFLGRMLYYFIFIRTLAH